MSNSRPGTESYQGKNSSLLQKFKGIISTPSDVETYDIKRWASNIEAKAAYILYPTDAADISVAILFAREQKLPLAITGAGHNVSGSSSAEGGVVIAMRNMHAVRVDKEKMVGYLEGGTTITQVTEELYKHGLATTMGHIGPVGCVGLALGGGHGFKMGQYGLAVDNIVSATVVLASGEIIFVDDEHHADLLWGLKGGGSNFGVVAELGMKLHKARPDLCVMQQTYPAEQLEAVVAELSAWFKVQKPEETIFFGWDLNPKDGKAYIVLEGIADLSAEDGRRCWDRFFKLNPIITKFDQVRYDTYCAGFYEFTTTAPANRVQGPAIVSEFDYESIKKTYEMWLDVRVKAPGSIVVWELYQYDRMAKTPVESTAFPLRSMDKMVLIGIYGYDDDWELEAKQAAADLKACVTSSSTEQSKNDMGYLNHSGAASENDTDAMAKRAFGVNYPRLQQLKRRYDPDVVFNKWFCIKPADE